MISGSSLEQMQKKKTLMRAITLCSDRRHVVAVALDPEANRLPHDYLVLVS